MTVRVHFTAVKLAMETQSSMLMSNCLLAPLMEDGQHGRSGQNLQKHVETTVELQSGLGNALTQNQLLVEPTAKDSVLKQEWTNFPNVRYVVDGHIGANGQNVA